MKKILIVDDEPILLDVMYDILCLDYEVLRECDPENVIRYFSPSIDLVITDYSMPNKNGVELINEIKERFDVPIILLSGSDISVIGVHNADMFISKPFSIKDLKENIKHILERTYEKDFVCR